MEQPSQGTPPVEQQPSGIAGIVEQSKVTQPTPAASPAAPVAPEYTPEQVAQWRTQAEEADKYKKQYENLLPEYTKSRQYIAQQLGVQPQQPQDQYAPFIKMAKDRGFDEDSARAVAEMADQIAQQRSGAMLQQFQYQNAGNQLPLIMQQAYGLAPQALQNPKVQEALKNEMMGLIQSGNFDLLNPEFAANRAKIIAFDQGIFVQGTQTQTPPPQTPNITSMWGIPQGHGGQPTVQAPKALTPMQEQQKQELQSRYPKATIQ